MREGAREGESGEREGEREGGREEKGPGRDEERGTSEGR